MLHCFRGAADFLMVVPIVDDARRLVCHVCQSGQFSFFLFDFLFGTGNGYLANIRASEFMRRFERQLPIEISGKEFLEEYGAHLDVDITVVDPKERYAIRYPTSHPVYENFRVALFHELMVQVAQTVHDDSPQTSVKEDMIDIEIENREHLEILGELMLQSHESYNACGLGSEGTDRLVQLVLEEKSTAQAAGRAPGLYGAKITGGGCGGERKR